MDEIEKLPEEEYNPAIDQLRENIEDLKYDKKQANIGMTVFIVLFLAVLGLFIYYQFYQGNGQWKFTFNHKSPDTSHVEGLNEKIIALQKSNDSLISAGQNNTGTLNPVDMSGTIYEVQIGAFKLYDPSKYTDNYTSMNFVQEDGFNKLTVGRFKAYNAASAFREDLRKMGIRKAWIVKLVDGNRTPISKNEM